MSELKKFLETEVVRDKNYIIISFLSLRVFLRLIANESMILKGEISETCVSFDLKELIDELKRRRNIKNDLLEIMDNKKLYVDLIKEYTNAIETLERYEANV